MPVTFLTLPIELRLYIFQLLLGDHLRIRDRTQPNNTHLRLSHTCRQSHAEATCLRSYLSLSHEHQITSFIAVCDASYVTEIHTVDVANDGRVVKYRDQHVPVSQLAIAIRRLPSIQHVRVFDCRRGTPTRDLVPGARLSLQFELAMFPHGPPPGLVSYEMYLDVATQNIIFQVVLPERIRHLRLSGRSRFPHSVRMPALTHLTVCGVMSSYLDQHLHEDLSQSQLQSFRYMQGDRMGFQMTDGFLSSLVGQSGSTLRQLVLLDCNRLSTATLSSALRQCYTLDYFALAFTSVSEMRHNFVLDIPETVTTLKLSVTNAAFMIPMINREESLCDALEKRFLTSQHPPRTVCLSFREDIAVKRRGRWLECAKDRRFDVVIGPWENEEVVQVVNE